jgi:condensin complex subunit 3
MALNSFQLFLSQLQTAPEQLKMPVLQVVFDILMVHGSEFLNGEDAPIPVCAPLTPVRSLIYMMLERANRGVPSIHAPERRVHKNPRCTSGWHLEAHALRSHPR